MQRKRSTNSTKSGPDASEKAWQNQIRSMGCIITGQSAVIHHVVGGSFRYQKMHIGEKFVLPLSDEVHKAMDAGKDGWAYKYFGFTPVGAYDAEKFLFFGIVEQLGWPFSEEELDAIREFTHR